MTAVIFLFSVTYHVISKLRGNEKNPQMNTYGILLGMLGLVAMAITFSDIGTFFFIYEMYSIWGSNQYTPRQWIWWTSRASILLYHWFFNLRYVKSTLRLPVLQKSAEFLNEMLERILEQREDQEIVFTAQELETQTKEMNELKKRQMDQEAWANTIEAVFLALSAVSAYTFVYVDHNKTINFFFVPTFLLLNATMLIAVVVMRFVIKRMPNLLPNENLVLVHVLLFTATTGIWIFFRVTFAEFMKALVAYSDNPSTANYINYMYAYGFCMKMMAVYAVLDVFLLLFMLYMLHQFSIFEGFVKDPITGEKVPVLSMFQTAKAMENSMKDRVLSDRQRAQIKRLLDYDEGQELFAASEHTASIAGSFVANDLGESMKSLRGYEEITEAVYSDTDSAGNEDDLEGEALQHALKGDPIPGSLGDENY